jgi:hypothetical protein
MLRLGPNRMARHDEGGTSTLLLEGGRALYYLPISSTSSHGRDLGIGSRQGQYSGQAPAP